jgi:hypothetical protein
VKRSTPQKLKRSASGSGKSPDPRPRVLAPPDKQSAREEPAEPLSPSKSVDFWVDHWVAERLKRAQSGDLDSARLMYRMIADRASGKFGRDLTDADRALISELFYRLGDGARDPLESLHLKPKRGNPAWKHRDQNWEIYEAMLKLIDPADYAANYEPRGPSSQAVALPAPVGLEEASRKVAATGKYFTQKLGRKEPLSARRILNVYRQIVRAFPMPK